MIPAVGFHLARGHRRVGGVPGFSKTLVLDFAGLHDTLADRLGLVSGGRIRGQVPEIHQWHLDMQIDPVQQRPRDALAAVLDLAR